MGWSKCDRFREFHIDKMDRLELYFDLFAATGISIRYISDDYMVQYECLFHFQSKSKKYGVIIVIFKNYSENPNNVFKIWIILNWQFKVNPDIFSTVAFGYKDSWDIVIIFRKCSKKQKLEGQLIILSIIKIYFGRKIMKTIFLLFSQNFLKTGDLAFDLLYTMIRWYGFFIRILSRLKNGCILLISSKNSLTSTSQRFLDSFWNLSGLNTEISLWQ